MSSCICPNTKSTPPRVITEVSCRLQVIKTVSVSSLIVENVPLWWGMSKMGEAVHVLGEGSYGNFLYCSLNFAANVNVSKKKV